jgi:hypothetical protein
MSDDPIRALARANPFPNDAPVKLPDAAVSRPHRHLRNTRAQRVTIALSLALGASVGWGLITAITEPATTRSNRCVVVADQVVQAQGVCIATNGP